MHQRYDGGRRSDATGRSRTPYDALVAVIDAPIGRWRAGLPAAAFSQKAFRWVFLGSFASNIGTWMQNFTLGALADNLTGKAWYLGLVTFAQLGPVLLFSPFGGVMADRFDRRRTMIGEAAGQ